MTSIKLKFRASKLVTEEGNLYFQIIHDRKIRQLNTDYRIFADEWDARNARVMIKAGRDRVDEILAIRENIRRDMERLSRIDRNFDLKGFIYTADDITIEFKRYAKEYTLFNFMKSQIKRLKTNGKIRTSETYEAALRSFRTFRKGEDLMLDTLTPRIMETYQSWLKSRGLAMNTISFYARIIRAVYNRAVDADIIDNLRPFRHVYTGIDKTSKRALPLRDIKKIKSLNLRDFPALDFARDMFMMSFYLRGMSFVDLAFLKKTDLCNGILSYRRRKTGQRLSIGWTREMQEIINKYTKNSTQYLMPVITSQGINERYAYKNAGYRINYNLKRIAIMAGVNVPLTMYVARHSWASIANMKGIPINIISEGMGHDSITTTQIYLASLKTSIIDKANNIILKSLK